MTLFPTTSFCFRQRQAAIWTLQSSPVFLMSIPSAQPALSPAVHCRPELPGGPLWHRPFPWPDIAAKNIGNRARFFVRIAALISTRIKRSKGREFDQSCIRRYRRLHGRQRDRLRLTRNSALRALMAASSFSPCSTNAAVCFLYSPSGAFPYSGVSTADWDVVGLPLGGPRVDSSPAPDPLEPSLHHKLILHRPPCVFGHYIQLVVSDPRNVLAQCQGAAFSMFGGV